MSNRLSNLKFRLVLILVLAAVLAACSTPTAVPATPQTVTLLQTVEVQVPVEVTRLVESTRLVEVTVQVVQTELVPVTITPTATPEATSTPEPTATLARVASYTPTLGKPEEKVAGIAPLRILNTTEDTLTVIIEGPVYYNVVLSPRAAVFRTMKEARYTYAVYRDGKLIYKGEMNITNPDKYELHLKEDRASFLVP